MIKIYGLLHEKIQQPIDIFYIAVISQVILLYIFKKYF